eukprot:PhF_6_TR21019/c0_g1_i1/m.30213/K19753/LRRC6; protein TilB
MVRITVDLLRRRAEHNEGCLSTLKEVALHQQDIEKIEVIGDACRELEIIYLCNNYIPRIEGLYHLKNLKYLNLAINNISVIEGLERCEFLEKLDLTLNFIGEASSVVKLRANVHLQALHLTGNPCTSVAGYREFVLHALPQLQSLDGEEVVPSQLIRANQNREDVVQELVQERMKIREQERIEAEMRASGIDPHPPQYDEKGERLYGHTPEDRLAIYREQQERERLQKEKQDHKEPGSIAEAYAKLNEKPKSLTVEEEIAKYGRVLQKNEAKVDYRLVEEKDVVIIEVDVGKFIATSSIELDIQPSYVRIVIKGKVLQLVPPCAITTTGAKVERATVNGKLKLTLPKDKVVKST